MAIETGPGIDPGQGRVLDERADPTHPLKVAPQEPIIMDRIVPPSALDFVSPPELRSEVSMIGGE